MTDQRRSPPDEPSRAEIRTELENNLLVEAGAGSGKTKSLVDRMVALVRGRRCKVGEIAAVTFTRKAAAELRQRFQIELERQARLLRDEADRMPPGSTGFPYAEEAEALEEAIRNLDAAFLGTIHSFCAKMLRERPLEAGLDPAFREMTDAEARDAQTKFWVGFLERLAASGDSRIKELHDLGMEPNQLRQFFDTLVEHPDVKFGTAAVDPPDAGEVEFVRAQFDAFLDRADELMPDQEPEMGWDSFANRVRTLLYLRRAHGWDNRIVLFDALARVYKKSCKPTQKRWLNGPAVKALAADFEAFAQEGSRACRLVESWWAHRYPFAVRFADAAAREFAQERKETGLLIYQDDLVLAAELLRENPRARRELGDRYKRILVDEFQDTDPLQAEILFLLASDPAADDDSVADQGDLGADGGSAAPANWQTATPRPGALFVVGDPKQSIYRFRRADISLYEFVKKRFQTFGRVVELQANFRSLSCIEDVVAGVFDSEDMFPADAIEGQAAFAPLRAWRDSAKDGKGRVVSYEARGGNQGQVVADDARIVAAHIARQIESGDRKPGDFMILTRERLHLPEYARVLEEWNIPVEVSGARAAAEFADKLSAFVLLFKCLSDPEHEVHVLGVLAGPFFGIALDELADYRNQREDGGTRRPPFKVNQPSPEWTRGPAAKAIRTLHDWWRRARREPADVTAERLADETGVFPLAAAADLGQMRAGALVYLLDAVRARVLAGDPSLTGAVEAMETALDWDDAEVSLVPGRSDAVRVMNLHRAKGLEAKVVFLAAPFGKKDQPPRMHVSRGEDGVPRGSVLVARRLGWTDEIIARPLSWNEDQKVETAFEKAEKTRLLYVAATRARDELWVSRCTGLGKNSASPWQPVERWIEEAAKDKGAPATWVEEMAREERPAGLVFDGEGDLASRTAASKAAVGDAGEPSYVVEAVTQRTEAKDGAPSETPPKQAEASETETGVESAAVEETVFATTELRPLEGGYEWGDLVHRMLMAASRGEPDDRLRQRARHLLVDRDRPVDERGDPRELDALMAATLGVRDSEVWRRAVASPEWYAEMPIAAHRPLANPSIADTAESPAFGDVLEGVVDLVFRDGDGWVVADYKTDTGEDPDFRKRLPAYRAQVDLYAESWEQITGEPVRERVLVFVAQGRVKAWQAASRSD